MVICYRRYCMLILGVFLFVMLVACHYRSGEGQKPLPPLPQASADKLFIVDCLLPGQVRKLGTSVTYLAPRQPVKTTALDCEIRGGEYVAYDRSNYDTALKVWLSQAEGGDKVAQTYVGEVYERGLGIEPDYALAAKWYQKAADQGYASAQINLGHLYEKGLGVPQDKTLALSWYRKAAGLDTIVLIPDETEAGRVRQQEVDQLRQEVQTLHQELEKTQQELEQTRQKWQQRKREAETEQHTLQDIHDKLTQARQELQTQKQKGTVDAQTFQSLKDSYQQQEQAMEQQSQKIQQLNQEVERLEQETQTYTQQLATLKQQLQQPQERGTEKIPPKKTRLSPNLFGSYHALIIGNKDYVNWPDLETPENDARQLAQLLENHYGFQTQVLLNADRSTILNTLNILREKLTEQDNLLIYYAGHGAQRGEGNIKSYWWIPVDGEENRTTFWISTNDFTGLIAEMAPKHVLIISDSCYSGNLLTRSALTPIKPDAEEKARQVWIKKILQKRSRTVLSSGGDKPVPDSGGEGHSVFARALIDFLMNNEEILEGEQLHKAITPGVISIASRLLIDQDPQYGPLSAAHHEAGDFFFVPQRSTGQIQDRPPYYGVWQLSLGFE